mgnify:CR=1 FL=1
MTVNFSVEAVVGVGGCLFSSVFLATIAPFLPADGFSSRACFNLPWDVVCDVAGSTLYIGEAVSPPFFQVLRA